MRAALRKTAVMFASKSRPAPSHPLTVLRAIFDLLEADLRPTPHLLGRLLGITPHQVTAALVELRRDGLVQSARAASGFGPARPPSHAVHDRLALTMAGLVRAVRLPEFEPVPAPASAQAVRASTLASDTRSNASTLVGPNAAVPPRSLCHPSHEVALRP